MTNKLKKEVYKKRNFEREFCSEVVYESIKDISKKTGVYSEEVFTGNLERRSPDGIDRSIVAKRLAEIFGSIGEMSTEVILVIREQRSFLLSAFTFWYHNYKSMGYETLDDIVKFGSEGSDKTAQNVLSWMRYFKTIEAYHENFGEENVHVLLYEDLAEDENLFVRHLSRIMGIDADKSEQLIDSSTDRNVTKTDGARRAPGKVYHWLSTFKSTYLSRVGSVRNYPLGQWVINWLKSGREVSLSESSISRLQAFYGEDNRKVEDEFNLKLSEHGYLIS
jgi:hypothetical protein